MSAPGLTSEAQLRYLLQWFGEFSELQREDFLPVLAAARRHEPDQLATAMAGMCCEDKPVSLFQCRIKLFNDWYPTWSEEEQDRLVLAVSEMDSEFGTKLQDVMVNGPQVLHNGKKDFYPTYIENGEAKEDAVENSDTHGVSQENIPVEIAAAS